MDSRFIHLHLHSEYSLVDGLIQLKPLVNAVAKAGMPAVALTDQGNLFGLVRFYKAAVTAGIKPIAGADLWIRHPEDPTKPHRLVLLIQDQRGYRNLIELVSRSFLKGQEAGFPQVDPAWIKGHHQGLIALAGPGSDLAEALVKGRTKEAERVLDRWLKVFGDRYYLELVRTGRGREGHWIEACVDLALRRGVPVVATNDVRFLSPDDFEAHEVRVCIHQGRMLDDPDRPRLYSEEQYLRTPAEMSELFADLPEALVNAVEIAKRCNLELKLGKPHLPIFPVPAGMTTESFFAEECRRGLNERLSHILDPADPDSAERRRLYEERLESELAVITQMGFAGYFLIVADFIRWAKENGIPVGPGRGSGAGSLAAYAIRITDLDPIAHNLLFERFLNPERVSMPDFDIDFCMEGRDRVIEYVAQKYGREAVSQIITFGTMAAKAVVRDVGRVMGYPYGFVDKIAKMVPFEPGMTLDKALAESEDLRRVYQDDEEVRALIDMARKLEGLTRNAGKHAGGVVIAPGKLTDFTPLYCEPGGEDPVTQYDKDDVEQVGLVKFDFLGLRTLTIIDWALKTINAQRAARGESLIDLERIDPHDPDAFAMLKRCETTAVFQLESRGMRELIKKLQPDCFDDITALVALFRPGPLQSGMVDDFIERKHGRAPILYLHPHLEPILKPTYGIILYQEQVMQIAQVLAGYSLGGADLLRRAMGKKKPEEMAKQRATFESGAEARGVDRQLAAQIFDLMEYFSGYGFNKSHSAAYALVSYQTLWLKAHYPAAFMSAVLSADMDNTDKVVTLIDECRSLGLRIEPPAINHSDYRFSIAREKAILYGLGAIKGVGASAIEAILQARAQGPFRDLWDLCMRVDLQRVNRRVLESLIRAGALDALGPNRATLMGHLPLALRAAEQYRERRAAGQVDLFGASGSSDPPRPDPQTAGESLPDWEDEERLRGEKETLGLYLTGHPLARYEDELRSMGCIRIARLLETDRELGRRERELYHLVGLVVNVRHSKGSRGRLGSMVLDDRTGRIEVTVFSELYEQVRPLLAIDQILSVRGTLSFDDFRDTWSLRADSVRLFEEARAASAHHLFLLLDLSDPAAHAQGLERVRALRELLADYRETDPQRSLPIRLLYRCPGAQGELMLGRAWRVRPADALLKELRQLLGPTGVSVSYERLPQSLPGPEALPRLSAVS
ncbi:DNA polymerase III subunit alpha [Caldichromatium japonicum]|uniref:DNA polymerase III subunit alpha n=1 Tax=Caldichromatium japonicum TaxID=2699430 RepID=A0A6G7VB50_9GAMM|nr:DNA polymerase III subunit alpha [Caldichromatium japonicum]QIK37096.1 DNA polymerase III subunit alpha [Caldichromatium japonicum]